MLLLISYDLDAPGRPGRYEAVHNAIAGASADWKRPLYSQWLVVTEESVDQWADRLTPMLTSEDRLLIVRVQGRTNGFLSTELWTWINARAI